MLRGTPRELLVAALCSVSAALAVFRIGACVILGPWHLRLRPLSEPKPKLVPTAHCPLARLLALAWALHACYDLATHST